MPVQHSLQEQRERERVRLAEEQERIKKQKAEEENRRFVLSLKCKHCGVMYNIRSTYGYVYVDLQTYIVNLLG